METPTMVAMQRVKANEGPELSMVIVFLLSKKECPTSGCYCIVVVMERTLNKPQHTVVWEEETTTLLTLAS
jgi:hypothetical protein